MRRSCCILILLVVFCPGILLTDSAKGLASEGAKPASRPASKPNSSRVGVSTTSLKEEAERALSRGDFRAAVQSWLGLSYQLARSGHYQRAIEVLDDALARPQGVNADAATRAALHGARGNLYIVATGGDAALVELDHALRLARSVDAPGTLATILNNRGNALSARGAFEDAIEAYAQAGEIAERIGSAELFARTLANMTRAQLDAGRVAPAVAALRRAIKVISDLALSSEKTSLLLHWSNSLTRIVEQDPALLIEGRPAPLALHGALLEAEAMAAESSDARAQSTAWGELAKQYARESRPAEALELTQRAIERARFADAPDLRYAWHALAAELLAASGKRDEAIGQYAEATGLLRSLRHSMGIRYGSQRPTNGEGFGEIYFAYVDQLLRRAAEADAPGEDLRQAQEVLEELKAAELRDYFRDECVDQALQSQVSAAQISASAAVLYPVLLEDRIEILVATRRSTWRRSVPISREQATEALRKFRFLLEKRTTREYLAPARQIYSWLIDPLLTQLAAEEIDSLVFVPDGALRNAPMSALHDGERFLIERFAVAVTPGLRLTDPKSLDRSTTRIFAGGVSRAVQGHAPLPFVADELRRVGEIFEGQVVVDESFRRDRIEQELAGRSFNIVHIASHASFDSQAEDTYVLTYDERLSMDTLASYVSLFRFRDQPLDLLMLSACETASGDDRAALGLSGLAVKAGARSAVGTLWSVNDEAAGALVASFYQHLSTPNVSRAEALRRAKRDLIKEPRFRHPGYWSAFILIGNWL